jgi:hypothetical protein
MCVCGEVDSNAAVWRKVSAARAFTLAAERGAPQRRVQFRSASAAAGGAAAACGLAHTYAYSAMETAPKGRNPQIYYRRVKRR